MIRPCTNCGQQNRVSAGHLADTGRCGACKSSLAPIAEPINVDIDSFDDIVANARVPVLIDFWAVWCGPCRTAAPEVQRVAKEMAGRAIVLKVDTEQSPKLSQRFQVMSIPNFVVMKAGRVLFQQPGLVDYRQMIAWLRQAGA